MQGSSVTVNGQDARQWVKEKESEAKSREVAQFLAEEMRMLCRGTRQHFTSSGGGSGTTHRQVGQAVRYYR